MDTKIKDMDLSNLNIKIENINTQFNQITNEINEIVRPNKEFDEINYKKCIDIDGNKDDKIKNSKITNLKNSINQKIFNILRLKTYKFNNKDKIYL